MRKSFVFEMRTDYKIGEFAEGIYNEIMTMNEADKRRLHEERFAKILREFADGMRKLSESLGKAEMATRQLSERMSTPEMQALYDQSI